MNQTLTGARAIFRIQGTQIAYASNCSYTINHQHQPIEVLDKLAPVEHAEVGYDVSFSCNTFRVANNSAVSLGVQPVLENILTQPELVVEIIDRISGARTLLVVGVKMTSRTGSVDARGVATESWSFVGLKASDEASAG